MPLPISQISTSERQALAQCDLKNQIVAIEMAGIDGPKIVTLARDQISLWQLFLQCFGWGNLATKKVCLSEVTEHLNRYTWAPDAIKDLSYPTVCQLANKALLKGDHRLFYSVSSIEVHKKMELMQIKDGSIFNQFEVVQKIHWNPALQVQHVIKQLRFPNSEIFMSSETERLSYHCAVSHDILKNAHITIQQNFSSRRKTPLPGQLSIHPQHFSAL